MNKHTIPFWYHPTTVLALDDDSRFLNLLKGSIDPAFFTAVETDPHKALAYLKRHSYDTNQLSGQLMEQNFDATPNNQQAETYEINLNQLKPHVFVADRYQKTVVCLVDRDMESMDGLEFCRMVKETENLCVKLILLTGVTTMGEAVSAFNEGKIDAYIEKRNKESTIKQVNEFLNKLARQQFEEMSQLIINKGLSSSFAHLSDPIFYETFNRVREAEGSVEFYLLDATGSFLLIGREGQGKILLVHADSDFEVMRTIADESDAPNEVLQALENRKQYPMVFLHEVSTELTGASWLEVMAPVTEIKDQKLFYSLIDQASFKGNSLL